MTDMLLENVEVVPSSDRQAWDAYVVTRKDSSPYHLYGWGEVYSEVLGCEAHHLMATEGARIRGVLPVLIVRNRLLGTNYVSSLPGGVCADDSHTARRLIRAAIELTRERGARYLKLRDGLRKWADEQLGARVEHTYVLNDVPPDPEVMWGRVKRNVRK